MFDFLSPQGRVSVTNLSMDRAYVNGERKQRIL